MTGRANALIRADASLAIGTGHVMRCVSLASELHRRGWSLRLATRDLPPPLDALAREAGLEVVALPDGVAAVDEPATLRRLVPGGVDVLITDHYGIDATWEQATDGWARSRMAINDLPERPHAVDVLLDPNLGATAERYAGHTTAQLLLGPMFAPLDRSYAAGRERARPREGLGRVLVFIGGSDPRDVTGRAARAAAALGVPVDVVVGSLYPNRDRLEAWAATRRDVEIHVATRHMADLVLRADVAIGAPGSASWERCALGLPAVLVTIADNQVANAVALASAGAAISLGRDDEVDEQEFEAALVGLRDDPARLAALSVAAAAITDGDGARRVADALDTLIDERRG